MAVTKPMDFGYNLKMCKVTYSRVKSHVLQSIPLEYGSQWMFTTCTIPCPKWDKKMDRLDGSISETPKVGTQELVAYDGY